MSTYIFVHGAWQGAWSWYKILPLMEKAGHRAVAVDLPSLGRDRTPASEVSVQSYVDRVSGAIEAQPGRAILVGHGRGGIVISQVAEQRPARVEMLVYLAAFLIPDGRAMLPLASEDAGSHLLRSLIVKEQEGCVIVGPAAWRDALYTDCSDEDLMLASSLLTPEPLAPVTTPLQLSERNFGRTPRVYIETIDDRALTVWTQRRMVAAMPCARVISMKTGHAPFFSAPEALVENLLSLGDTARDTQSVLTAFQMK